MNVFDIVITVILLFAFVRGIINGFFSEVASLIAVISGVFFAIHFSYHIESFLNEFNLDWSDKTIKIVSFAITFLLVVFAVILVGKLLTKLAKLTSLGLLNKILGGVFSTLKSVLILSVIFLFFDKFNKTIPFVKEKTLEESVLYYPINSIVPTIFPSILDIENPSFNFFDTEE